VRGAPEFKSADMGRLLEIASPLADEKALKKVLKAVKKASKDKAIKLGSRDVAKAIRKGAKGFCVIGGDVDPMDVVSHFPVLLEEANIPYIWVESKDELGANAFGRTMSATAVLVLEPQDKKKEYAEAFDKAIEAMKAAHK